MSEGPCDRQAGRYRGRGAAVTPAGAASDVNRSDWSAALAWLRAVPVRI